MLVLSLVFGFISTDTEAQKVAGYMGKKNSIEAGPEYATLGLQLSWGASFFRAVGRKTALGVKYYNVTGDLFRESHAVAYQTGGDITTYYVNARGVPPQGDVKAEYVGLHMRTYLGQYIAPVGTCIDFGIGRYIVNGVDNGTITASYNQGEAIIETVDASHAYNHISAGIAQKWVIGGGNLFSEVAGTINYFWSTDSSNGGFDRAVREKDLIFPIAFREDQLKRNLIRLKVSVGYMF